MKQNKVAFKFLLLAVVVFSMIVLSACSSGKQMASSWQQEQLQMKGDLSFWRNKVFEVPDKKLGVGFANDDKFMYVCLTTDDRSKIFQIFRNGFIVWFEPESSNYKIFGIKYPLVNIFDKPQQMEESNPAEIPRQDNQRNFSKMLENQNELEVVNQDKYPMLALPLVNKEGIEAKLSFVEGRLVYELKVPLAVSQQYSFPAGAAPGEKIRVRFETLETGLERMGKRSTGFEASGRGERPPGAEDGIPRGSGGYRGGIMHPGVGRAGGLSEPLNFSVVVKLENQPVSK